MSRKTEIILSILLVIIVVPWLDTVTHGQISRGAGQIIAAILNGLLLFLLTLLNQVLAIIGPVVRKVLLPFAEWALLWAVGLFVLYKVFSQMYDGMKKKLPPAAAKKKKGGH